MEFITLNKQDRKLARAMGLDMELPHPWIGTNILDELIEIRDQRVDALLRRKLNEDDDMAEDACVQIPRSGRAKLYQKAEVPPVIQITFRSFEVEGGMHPDMTLNVLSTVSKASSIAIELTTRNLEFLRACAHSKDVNQPRKRKRQSEALDLPELTQPCVFWRRRGRGRPTIMVQLCTEAGVWRTHNETPAAVSDHDAFVKVVRESELRVQQFYNDNHHEPGFTEELD